MLWSPRGLGGSVNTDAQLDAFLERAAMLMDPSCMAPGGKLKPSALERALTALHAFGGDVDAACVKLMRTGAVTGTEEGGAAGLDRAIVAFERAARAHRRLERRGRVGSVSGAEVDDVDGGAEEEGEDEDGVEEEEGEEEEDGEDEDEDEGEGEGEDEGEDEGEGEGECDMEVEEEEEDDDEEEEAEEEEEDEDQEGNEDEDVEDEDDVEDDVEDEDEEEG